MKVFVHFQLFEHCTHKPFSNPTISKYYAKACRRYQSHFYGFDKYFQLGQELCTRTYENTSPNDDDHGDGVDDGYGVDDDDDDHDDGVDDQDDDVAMLARVTRVT